MVYKNPFSEITQQMNRMTKNTLELRKRTQQLLTTNNTQGEDEMTSPKIATKHEKITIPTATWMSDDTQQPHITEYSVTNNSSYPVAFRPRFANNKMEIEIVDFSDHEENWQKMTEHTEWEENCINVTFKLIPKSVIRAETYVLKRTDMAETFAQEMTDKGYVITDVSTSEDRFMHGDAYALIVEMTEE